jgi:hypothetical protein
MRLARDTQFVPLFTCAIVFLCAPLHCHGQDSLKSGPQAGQPGPGLFNSLIVHGDYAGKLVSLVQLVRGGWNNYPALPYALVFIRATDDHTLGLIRKLDDEAAQSKKFRVGIVFLSDDSEIEGRLKKIVEKEKFRAVIVSVYASEGPKPWNIAKDAEVTVVFSGIQRVVQANYAFRKGELGETQLAKIMQAAKALKEKS